MYEYLVPRTVYMYIIRVFPWWEDLPQHLRTVKCWRGRGKRWSPGSERPRAHTWYVCVRMRSLAREHKSGNKGLISADRRTEPTLVLTIPRSFQVVYKRFIETRRLELLFSAPPSLSCSGGGSQLYGVGPKPILTQVTPSSMGIVAFQHGF